MAKIVWNHLGGFEIECSCDQCATGYRCSSYHEKYREASDELLKREQENEDSDMDDMDRMP